MNAPVVGTKKELTIPVKCDIFSEYETFQGQKIAVAIDVEDAKMGQISIILVAGLIFLFYFDLSQEVREVNTILAVSATLAFTFLPAIIAYFLSIAATRRLSNATESRIKQLYMLKKSFFVFEIIILVTFVMEIYYLNLPLLVDRWLAFWTFSYTRRLTVLIPLLAGILLVRLSNYELDKRARLTNWSRRGYLSLNLKFMILPVVPVLVYLIIWDIVEHAPLQVREFFIKHAYLTVLVLAMLIVFMFIKAPMLLRLIWKAKPLSDQELRNQLDNLAAENRIKYKDITVWQTGGAKIANAGVAGLLPSSRRIFITDYLLENFSHEEINTVVAHEFGHIRHKHIHLYMLFSFAYFLCYIAFYTHVAPTLEELFGSGPIVSAIISIFFFFLYFVIFFRYFSRRFEHQADCYAVQITGASETYKQALWRLSLVNYMPNTIRRLLEILQTHPSIARRLAFIDRLSAGSPKAVRYKRTLIEAKMLLIAAAVLSVFLFYSGRELFSASADVYFEVGRQYYQEAKKIEEDGGKDKATKNYNKALGNFKEGIRIDPKHIDMHFGMGITYEAMGETDKALEFFEKTVALYPKHAKAYLGMGIIYADRKEWRKTSEAFEKVVELEPDNEKAQKVLEDIREILELKGGWKHGREDRYPNRPDEDFSSGATVELSH